MFRPFGQQGVVTQIVGHFADAVAVNQLGVAESGRPHAEQLFHRVRVQSHLPFELLFAGERRQRVGVGFGQKFHRAALRQLAETVDHLRRVELELFDGDAGNRERYPHVFGPVFPDHLQQQLVHGQVARCGDFLENAPVEEVVEIKVIFAHVEEPVFLQSERLVYLKV